ncbi:LysM peptidoglycan-binding domain-containing protein [Nonomuraea sp. NPDC059194]|uniref:LysM peptidoglycan-binding domain-containing protein n=1 Tax=Nonomuraea sp. NPDC059194 TaxID=3346764 RepID=UPI00367A5B25
MTREASINPATWNWNPASWGWDFDPGTVLNPGPLFSTLSSMWHALPLMFSDSIELRLMGAAAAHRKLDSDLDKLHQAIDPAVLKIVEGWQGGAAEQFRIAWGKVVDPKARAALRQSCVGVAEVLEAVLNATNMTKQAIIELVRTAVLWAALFFALRFAASIWAAYLAYLKTTRLVMAALALLQRLAALFRTAGTLLARLPLAGRLTVVPKIGNVLKTAALRPFDITTMTKLASASFKSYAKTSAWVYGGVIGTQMAAQGMKGESIFNLNPMTFAQAGRITTAATLAGVFLPLAGPFSKGLLQGGSAASWAATLTKSGTAVAESGMAFGGFVAARNFVTSKLPWLAKLGPDAQKQALGFAPTAAFRVWRPLQTSEVPEQLPAWDRPAVEQWSVNEGSLWEVADKVWGDGSRWREIYDANRDLIGPDPKVLRVGQVLTIPG